MRHADLDKVELLTDGNIDPAKLLEFSFASRRGPEFMCHRLVQYPNSELVYADQPFDSNSGRSGIPQA